MSSCDCKHNINYGIEGELEITDDLPLSNPAPELSHILYMYSSMVLKPISKF